MNTSLRVITMLLCFSRSVSLDFKTGYGKSLALVVLGSGAFLYGWMVVRAFTAHQLAADPASLARLQRACALEPANADYPMRQASYIHRHLQPSQRAKARECYYQSLRRNPFNAWCWFQLARLETQAGDAGAAEQAMRAAERLRALHKIKFNF
ncbi:MAG: tetratricopeptide repeat protein [Acidobacteria bacterium]|nr:tetratricopeptide repeat protein [Acidobacteriota bacterium]MBI3657583.1 tetratricopeptide repeat protein [Acidobacteriota bacterium]